MCFQLEEFFKHDRRENAISSLSIFLNETKKIDNKEIEKEFNKSIKNTFNLTLNVVLCS